MVALQGRDGAAQGLELVDRRLAREPATHHRQPREHGQRGAAVLGPCAQVPAAQHRLRGAERGGIGLLREVARGEPRHELCERGIPRVSLVVLDGLEVRGAHRCVRSQRFLEPQAAVGDAGLETEGRREVRRDRLVAGTAGHQGCVVGVEDVARGRRDHLRHLVEGLIALPQRARGVARQHAPPVEGRVPARERRVVDVGDAARGVGVNVVLAGDRLQAQRSLEIRPILGAVELVVALHGVDPVHVGVAQRVAAMRPAQHRAVHRPQRLAPHADRERAEEPQFELRLAPLETPPSAIEAVPVGIRGIDDQAVGVREVRRVHGVGPAQCRSEAVQDERRTREHAAGHVPALGRLQAHLVPSERAGVGLVRVDQQPRGAVRRAHRRHRHGVRTAARGHRLGRRPRAEQRADVALEAEEERREEREPRHQILGRHRLEAVHDRVRMLGRVEVHAVGIALQHRQRLARDAALGDRAGQALAHALAHPQQRHEVIGDGGIRPLYGERPWQTERGSGGIHQPRRLRVDARCAATARHQALLQGGEVVLGVGVGEAERHVLVTPAVDVRHTEIVA